MSVNPDQNTPKLHYHLNEVDECFIHLEVVDLHISWESVYESRNRDAIFARGLNELNLLLEKKVESILKEKNAVCAYMKHETVKHKINYAHFTFVMEGDYILSLYAS